MIITKILIVIVIYYLNYYSKCFERSCKSSRYRLFVIIIIVIIIIIIIIIIFIRYFNSDILPTIIDSIYNLPTECNRLQYLFTAFEDGIKMCQMVNNNNYYSYFNYLKIWKYQFNHFYVNFKIAHSDIVPFYKNYR